MIRLTALAFAAALILPAPLTAQAIEEKNVVSGKAKLDPAMGYIFLQGPTRQNALFVRVPDVELIAEYEAKWTEELGKAQKKYAKALKRWEQDVLVAKQTRKKAPEKPTEPTAENFSIGPIEAMVKVPVGPQYVFAKADKGEAKSFSYLHAMKPGTYAYYGPIFTAPNGGAMGSCYCMGTVKFEVKAGVITDLGNFLLVAPGRDPAFPLRGELKGSEFGIYNPQALGETFGPVRYGVPDTLKALPAVVADFRAQGLIENFYGINVSRMPPVEGVLAYDRDKVIDLKAAVTLPATSEAAAVPTAAE